MLIFETIYNTETKKYLRSFSAKLFDLNLAVPKVRLNRNIVSMPR